MPNPDHPNLARALLALQKEQTSGVLEVRAEGIRTLVYLSDGMPSYAEEGTLDETLGRLLMRRRKLSYEQYKRVIDHMSQAMIRGQQVRFGEAVESLGFLTTADVNVALAEQMRSKVVRCLQWEKPDWDFDASPERLRRMASFPTRVEPMILAAAKLMPPARRRDVLAGADKRHPLFFGETSDIATRYGLTAAEEAILATMDGMRQYEPAWSEMPIGAVLAALMMSNDVLLLGELEAEAKRAASFPPVTKAPQARQVVLKKSVPPRGRKRSRGHMAPPTPSARRNAVKVIGRLRNTRRSIMKLPDAPTKKPANIQEARLLAEQAFQTGRGCLRANMLDRAAPLLKRAADLYPEAIEYVLYSRWVDFRLRKADAPTGPELHAVAAMSVKRDPNFAFGHYVLGHLARIDGDAPTAVALFAHASKLDPELIDKERHVRIVRPPPIPALPAKPPPLPARATAKAAASKPSPPPVAAQPVQSAPVAKPRPAEKPQPASPSPAPAVLPSVSSAPSKAPTSRKSMKLLAATALVWLGAFLVWTWWMTGRREQAGEITPAPSVIATATTTATQSAASVVPVIPVVSAAVTASGAPSAAPSAATPSAAPSAATPSAAPSAATPSAAPSATPIGSTLASAAPSGSASGTGEITMPPGAVGHRVFLDGRVLSQGTGTFTVPCGHHVVKVGSAGKALDVDVPCGGGMTIPE